MRFQSSRSWLKNPALCRVNAAYRGADQNRTGDPCVTPDLNFRVFAPAPLLLPQVGAQLVPLRVRVLRPGVVRGVA